MINSFEIFKKNILANIDNVDIAFEVGFCYKNLIPEFEDYNYWSNCYCFLKGIAHYNNIKCLR